MCNILWNYNTFSNITNIEKVTEFLKKGNDINVKDICGWTLLMNASYYNYKDIVKLLLKEGANINDKNKNGWTSLIYASYYNHTDIVKLLLKEGVNINDRTDLGY